MAPRRSLVLLAFGLVYVIWGSTYLAIKVAVETLPPLLMAGTRFILAGLLLWLIVPGDRRLRPTRRDWTWAFVIGALMLLSGNGILSIAESKMPSGIAALLITCVPFWMVLVDFLLNKVKPGPLALAGIVIGFAGVALLAGESGGWEGGVVEPLYVGGVLFGSLCWAVGSILARRGDIKMPTLRAIALQMVAGGILLTVVGFGRGEWGTFEPAAMSWASLAAWAYLIVFGAVVAYTAYGWLLTVQPSAVVSTYAFVNPVVAVALGWLVLREPVGPRTLLATPLIVGAVAIVIYAQARRMPSAQPAAAQAPAK